MHARQENTINGQTCEKTEQYITFLQESCCHIRMVCFFLHNFYSVSCVWGRTQWLANNTSTQGLLRKILTICLNLGQLHLHNVTSGLPVGGAHVSTLLASWCLINYCSKAKFATISFLSYSKLQAFSKVRSCSWMKTNIAKCHKNPSHSCTCVLLWIMTLNEQWMCLVGTGWLHFECHSLHIHQQQCREWWRCHFCIGRAWYTRCTSSWE